MSDSPGKWGIFEHSYDEVLAALKHQDEKLNRTLTALAFLTAAGVALFVQLEGGESPARRVVFVGEGGPPVTGVLFVIFLGAVAIALVTALAAIGPGTPLRFKRSGGRTDRSLLFYVSIAADDEWESRLRCEDESLAAMLARNFHAEAKDIAQRINYKIARSRESGAFVQLAIVALGLLGIFAARGFTLTERWWLAFVLLTVMLTLPFWELDRMRRHSFEEAGWNAAYVWLAIAVVLTLGALVGGELQDQHWPALYLALTLMLVSRLAVVSRNLARRIIPVMAVAAVAVMVVVWL